MGRNRIRTLEQLKNVITLIKKIDCGKQVDDHGELIEVKIPESFLKNNTKLKIIWNYKIIRQK